MVDFILRSRGVWKAQQDFNGENSVFAATKYNNLDILKILRKHMLYSEPNHKGSTPLHLACFKNYTNIARFLVEEMNADINAKTLSSGHTPYHMACKRGNLMLMKYLEKKGIEDVKGIKTKLGLTPLHLACQ